MGTDGGGGVAPTAGWMRRRTIERIRAIARRPGAVDRRLCELEQEWDAERVVQASGALLVFAGCRLAWRFGRAFLLVPIAVSALLVQQAVRGRSGIARWVEHLGYRPRSEIQAERDALRVLRGDLRARPGWGADGVTALLDAVSRT